MPGASRAFLLVGRTVGQGAVGALPRTRPTMAEMTNRTIATKKMIFAISTAKPAIPPKPSTAAISATTRKVKAQPSMMNAPRYVAACGRVLGKALGREKGFPWRELGRSFVVLELSIPCGIDAAGDIGGRS